LTIGSVDPSVPKAQLTFPFATETKICVTLLKGAWIIFVPVRHSNSALPRCEGLPMQGVP